MSHEHHSESGRHRGERKEHDKEARAYEERVYTGWHLHKNQRRALIVLAVVAGIAFTVLFMGGFLHW